MNVYKKMKEKMNEQRLPSSHSGDVEPKTNGKGDILYKSSENIQINIMNNYL